MIRNRSRMGHYDWPHTRIRRQGLKGYKNLKARIFFRSAAFYLIPFFVFALAYVWARIQVIETGYRLRQLEEKRDQLKEENRSLTVEVAMLKSPQKLEKIAGELGLKRPSENQIYFIKPPTVSEQR